MFLDPGLLAWLGLALPAILALYFLKLRRQEVAVPSTLLWRRSVHDLRVNAPFQRLRRDLLLLLQLLVAALLIAALARPFTRLLRGQGREAALILDCSASMGTRDEAGGLTRLEAAKAEALRRIGALGGAGGPADSLCVIAAADRPVLLCGLTSDPSKLREAVGRATLRATRTDMTAAVEMAVAVMGVSRNADRLESGGEITTAARREGEEKLVGLSAGAPRTQADVWLFSDGAFPRLPERLADRLSAPAVDGGEGSLWIPFGKPASDNLALVAADLQDDPTGLGGRQFFLRLENYGPAERDAEVEVELAGRFLDRKRVRVSAAAPGAPGQLGLSFDLPAGAVGVLRARLPGGDSLPEDDAVEAVVAPVEPIRALVVTTGNRFLASALGADRRCLFETIAPEAWPEDGPPPVKGAPCEIVWFDRFAPPTPPPGASVYLGVPPRLPGLVASSPPLDAAWAVDWNRAHPLMRGLSLLDRIETRDCLRLQLSGAWVPLLDGEGLRAADGPGGTQEEKLRQAPVEVVPLLACLVSEERRVAALAFDPLASTWPTRISFPLFVRNATHWLARPGGYGGMAVQRTGEALRIELPGDRGEAEVIDPAGVRHKPARLGPRTAVFAGTWRPGLYRVLAGGAEQIRAFHLLSGEESDNARRETVVLGRGEWRAETGSREVPTDLWPWAVAAALLLLLVEWVLYNKRLLG